MGTLQVLILGVSRYNFEDKGKILTGTSVHYVQLTHANEEDKVGYFPTKANLPIQAYEQFKGHQFPLQAEAIWELDMSNKRNPIKIKGFEKLETVLVD